MGIPKVFTIQSLFFMASPQKENGHIDIANEVAEKLGTLHMSGNEWMIWWVVLRKTWGWKKKEDRISLTQFQKFTGLSRPAVVLALERLVAKNVLVAKPLPLGKEFSFNKDYETWTSSEKATSSIINTKVVAKPLPSIVAKPLHTKDTTTKDTIQKTIIHKNVLGFGNPDINECQSYFLQVFQLPEEDCSKGQSRQYWNHLIRASKTGVQGVKWLIDRAFEDEFYKNNITSSKDLYYKRVKIVSRKRGDIPKVAVMPKEAI